ncbi:adenylyltransferase/cytidyltransferase family protein [Thioclava sp. 'Guangxiensis']|uniref:adenylyltransferase/cytidyltransferase family protein n=1 Tax=Thioclava sp. 'Guangxiensis' TaxID=3149044 RepID=UPI003877D890
MTLKVITYGTFDLFHHGHVRLLQRLADLGDHLTVAVSTDEFNAIKGKRSSIPYAHRAEIVAACRYVDEVIPEEHWEQKRRDIERLEIDIFAMGDDWAGHFDDLSDLCEVIYLERTKDVSSTEIKLFVRSA